MHDLMARKLFWCVGLGAFVASSVLSWSSWAAPLDLHWPQFRHDAAHTNFSSGKGHLDAPTVKWRLPLGGQAQSLRPLDVDLDGADDFLAIEGGRVSARKANGQVLWASAQLAATWISAIGDVDGDGLPEIAVAATTRAHLLRASDGSVLWSSAVQLPALTYLAMADFDGDGFVDVAVGGNHGPGANAQPATTIVGFVGGQKLIATTAVSPTGADQPFVDGQCTVDIDGDGALDILLPGFTHFYAFSGKTGQLLGQSPALPTIGLPPLTFGAIRPDPAKAPIILYAADVAVATYLWHGVAAMQLQGGELKLLWSALLPEVTSQRYVAVRGSIADLDDDGVGEVIGAKFDQGAWQLEARDAETGAVLHTLVAAQMPGAGVGGPMLRGVVRVVAGVHATLVVQRVDTAAAPSLGALSLWQWTRTGGFVQYADLGLGAASTGNWRVPGEGVFAAAADPIPTLQAWGDTPAAQGDLLVDRDVDGDHTVDHLEHLRVAVSGAVTSVGQIPRPLGSAALGMAVRGSGSANALLRSDNTGLVALLDATGAVQNDSDKNGIPDLRYGGNVNAYLAVAPAKDSEARGRVLVSFANRVQLLDATAAGPMTPPAVAADIVTSSLGARGNFADVNGDGQRDIVVRSLSSALDPILGAYGLDAKALWSYTHPGGPWKWSLADSDPFLIADVNGDGAEDLICQWDAAGPSASNQVLTVISGKDGQDLWPSNAECRLGATAIALDTQSTPRRILSSMYRDRLSCDAATGKVLEDVTPKEPRYGVPMLTDLDGDGAVEQILAGSSDGLAAETTKGFQTLWQAAVAGAYHAAGALVLTGATPLVAHASLTQPTLTVVAAKTGAPLWSFGYVAGAQVAVAEAAKSGFATVGLLAAADLTGAGHPSLLFRTTEGYLYCVNALTGAVDWTLSWGGAFGDPIVADIDGDGELEMLATYSDGALYAFDHSNLPAVAWVRENDGTGPALDDAADIDQQEDSQTLHANWAAQPGAQGYAVSVLDQGGATVLTAQNVVGATAVTLTGLTMHLGQRYQVAVQAYTAQGADPSFAPTALSDGVTIVDNSAPWIDGQELQPAAVQAGGLVHIVADLHDKTLVRDWSVSITPTGEATSVWQAQFKANQANIHVDLPWTSATASGAPLPAGDYTVHLVVHDAVGSSATADLTLHVCASAPFSAKACFASDLVGQDGSNGADDVSSVPQTADEGCGCRVAATHRGVPLASLWLIAACLWLLRRARTAN